MAMDALRHKEEGNTFFKNNQYAEAVACYTKALDLEGDVSDVNRAVFYKNRAACELKLENYLKASEDATAALQFSPHDTKSLFRRCQAFDYLGKHEEAFQDAVLLLKLEPKNTAIVPLMRKLNNIMQDKATIMRSTDNKVSQMFQLLENPKESEEKRNTAINNVLVLAREDEGARKIVACGGVEKLCRLLDDATLEMFVNVVRVMAALANPSHSRALAVLQGMTPVRICSYFGKKTEEMCSIVSVLVQSIINGVSDISNYIAERDRHTEERRKAPQGKRPFRALELSESDWEIIDTIFGTLIRLINSHKVSGPGRNCIFELLIKNVDSTTGLKWIKKFLKTDGLSRVLEVSGMMPGVSAIDVTDVTRMHCSALLSRLYDDLRVDKDRDEFRERCRSHFSEMFGDRDFESKLEAIVAVSTLLQGPFDIGNSILSTQGVLDVMLTLANSTDALHQKIAAEALVHATSKKDKCTGIIKQAVPILKNMYQSCDNDYVKVRALVGLCKLGSYGGTDVSAKSFAEGSTRTLSKACRKYLTNTAKDRDLRKWACMGLAYLTLDADVKEEVSKDNASIQALIELAKCGDQTILFPATTIFMNLTNSYDKPEILPEMLELAKYAKHHIPEDHEKDKPEFIKGRIDTLVEAGVASALFELSKTESDNCLDQIGRVFLGLTAEVEHRGAIVQQGGGKALISLALKGPLDARARSAQALARLAITINPEVAFPGQRILETVRPLLSLLHLDKSALQNFEALMALTNIASISDSARNRIVSEKGPSLVEHYMFEDHELLKRAATECMCNLVMNETVFLSCLEEDSHRIKVFMLYCGDDQVEIQKASCGALAMMSDDTRVCEKILQVAEWKELLLQVAVSEDIQVQHRAVFLLRNLMKSSEKTALAIVESQLLEVLMARSRCQGNGDSSPVEGDPTGQLQVQVRSIAKEALDAANEYGLIKSSGVNGALPERVSK